MKAVRFHASIPRYVAGKALSKLSHRAYWNGWSCTRLEEVDEPRLLSEEWVKIKTRYGGICGSDLTSIRLDGSLYYSPLSSFPFTFGHEAVGYVAEVGDRVEGFRAGDRVVLEPLLSCKARGVDDECHHCATGAINLCERVSGAPLVSGLMIGANNVTGGSWSPVFVAHHTQLYHVPEQVSDENALMVEPFACGLHAVLQNYPKRTDTILIIGAGTIGLMVLAALCALGSTARKIVVARHSHQAEAARRLGADEVISQRGDYYQQVVGLTGGSVIKTILGKPAVLGGAGHTFVCTGSEAAVDDALRLTRGGGHVTLVSAPATARTIDWTPFFIKELCAHTSYAYHHAEQYEGSIWTTFALALHLMEQGKVDLGWIVTHRFRLQEYQQALTLLDHRKSSQVMKAVFDFAP